jgi:hypothetical protein
MFGCFRGFYKSIARARNIKKLKLSQEEGEDRKRRKKASMKRKPK